MAKHRSHIVRPVTAEREMFTNRTFAFVFSDKIEDWITSNSTTGYTKRVKREKEKEKGIGEREGTMNITKTERGFPYAEFTDRYGNTCSIQKSSLAFEDCIWLGVNEPNPQVMWKDAIALGLRVEYLSDFTGWVDYPLPEQVVCTTRMHLTIDQVKALLPLLQRFVETGEIQEVDNV